MSNFNPKRIPIFNVTEERLIQELVEMFKVPEATAVLEVIKMKRNQSQYYRSQGNTELADHLLYEIGDI